MAAGRPAWRAAGMRACRDVIAQHTGYERDRSEVARDSSDIPLTWRQAVWQGGRAGWRQPTGGQPGPARAREQQEVPNLMASYGNVRPWGIHTGSLGDVCPQPAMGVSAGPRGHQRVALTGGGFLTKPSTIPAFAADQHREASG
jgi:hypothetical protein